MTIHFITRYNQRLAGISHRIISTYLQKEQVITIILTTILVVIGFATLAQRSNVHTLWTFNIGHIDHGTRSRSNLTTGTLTPNNE